MKTKAKLKICVDVAMTIVLLFLMAYSLIGEAAHEWIGMGMFLLFLVHHVLNRTWSRNVIQGRYTAVRVWQTLLVFLVLVCMTGSMISGVILSHYVFPFLPMQTGWDWARTMHMLCAYWGFVVMSLHIGFHYNMMIGITKKHLKKLPDGYKWLFRILAIGIALYGVAAFVKRDVGSYMFLKNIFVFLDFEEPLVFFFVDYIAIMGLFVFVGHYFTEFLKYCQRK